MYKKAIVCLGLMNVLLIVVNLCVTGTKVMEDAAQPAFEMTMDSVCMADTRNSTVGIASASASDQRVVDYGILERPDRELEVEKILHRITIENLSVETVFINDSLFSQKDLSLLLQIVEAEAGGEDEEGKLLVANVVLNRVNSDEFPDTITAVIMQQSEGVTQFSPVSNGRIWTVEISEETISAVARAVCGEDISQGALFFAARKYADTHNMRWFDQNLTYLFTHGNHEFFS